MKHPIAGTLWSECGEVAASLRGSLSWNSPPVASHQINIGNLRAGERGLVLLVLKPENCQPETSHLKPASA